MSSGTGQQFCVGQIFFSIVQRAGANGRVSLPLARMSFKQHYVGIRLAAQAAYYDPIKNAVAFTNSTWSEVAPEPEPYAWNRVYYVASSPLATTGTFMDHIDQPVFRYGMR